MDHPDFLRFVQLRPFSRQWDRSGLLDEDLRRLELRITADPTAAPVITNTGGLGKTRVGHERRQRGRRGAYRVCYAYFPEYSLVLLVAMWEKHEKAELGPLERRRIQGILQEIQQQLDQERL